MKNQKNVVDIDNFLNAISSMLESKYILIDRKISDILQSIATTKDVYNVIAKCMINYDFKSAWENALNPNFIKLPDDENDRVAFIFCMLNNIDDKNLDITMVLDKYFSYNAEVKPYELFCKNIIVEFKTLILRQLNIEDIPEANFEGKSENVDEFIVLVSLLHDFEQYVLIKKKWKHTLFDNEKLISFVDTFEKAAKDKRKEYFQSFIDMINSAIYKNKELKAKFKLIEDVASGIIRR